MKTAGPDLPLSSETTKSPEALYTRPVGLPSPATPAGMFTMSELGLPSPSYRVYFELPLSDTQTSPSGLKAMPQGFWRFASM